MSEQIITIDLISSIFARRFKKDEMIHGDAYTKVKQLIHQQLEAIKQDNLSSDKRTPRYHNAISVFGARGTGKTSFLYSVLESLKEPEYSHVEVLGFLDPTLIEEKEHIFLLVVSLINDKVNDVLKKAECDLNTQAYIDRRCWNEQLKKLAAGLPTLEKIGEDHRTANWHNHDFIMERGLNDVLAAFKLEDNFHALVNEALRILNKKAFVLALDDIDVDMRKGADVLEMIRKYLTTPRIITILSGNYKLYSMNVRRIQWRQLKDNRNFEKDKDFTQMVNELEGHYLMKVLNPENRIRLYSLLESQIYYSRIFQLAEFDETKNIRLEDAYYKVLSRWGICGNAQLNLFRDYLMSLSVRSQIHFLLKNETDQSSNIESVEAFVARLYASKVNVDLAVSQTKMLNIIIQQYLQRFEFAPENYLLTPNTDNDDMNACFTAFTILFAKQVQKNPFLLLDYAVRIGFTRNLLLRLNQAETELFYKHVGLNQSMSLRNCVGLSIAYVYGSDVSSYSISLRGLAAKSKKGETDKEGRIDYELSKEGVCTAAKVIGYLPVFLIAKNNDTRVLSSSYSLLALLADLLGQCDTVESITEKLLITAQLRIYPALTKSGSGQSEVIEEANLDATSLDNLIGDTNQDASLSVLSEDIWKWKNNFPKLERSIPPYLIGKIMTRLASAIQQINQPSMGEYMHRCVIALLNACLIEETLEYYQKEERQEGVEKMILNNVVTNDRIFHANLNFINRNNATIFIPITKWLMSCPLLEAYIRWDNTMKSHFYPESQGFDFLGQKDRFSRNVYEILCEVKKDNWVDPNKQTFSWSKNSVKRMIDILKEHELYEDGIENSNPEDLRYKINDSKIFAKPVSLYQMKRFIDNLKSYLNN